MEKTKLTKRDYFKRLAEIVAGDEELTNFINHEIELLDKKANSRSNTETAKQKENEALKALIRKSLGTLDTPVTISELQAKIPELSTTIYSNQRISALMSAMVKDFQVTRIEDKRKAYFTVREDA